MSEPISGTTPAGISNDPDVQAVLDQAVNDTLLLNAAVFAQLLPGMLNNLGTAEDLKGGAW